MALYLLCNWTSYNQKATIRGGLSAISVGQTEGGQRLFEWQMKNRVFAC